MANVFQLKINNMSKLIRILFLVLPIIAIILITFAEHSKYLNCLLDHRSKDDTVEYCTFWDGRWDDSEYAP